MRPLNAVAVVLLSLLFVLPVSADEVVLKNGQRIHGIVTEGEKSVTIRLEYGTMEIKKTDVKEIIRSKSPLEQYAEKRVQIKDGDVKGLLALAAWSKKMLLYTKERGLYETVIKIDTDNAVARKKLGYRKHKDKWLTEESYYSAIGYVKYHGEWLPKDVALTREKEVQKTLREKEKIKSDEKIAALQAEIEAARIEVEKLKAENELKARKIYYILPHYHSYGTLRCPCWCKKP